jgi:predicted dehydrogenase
MDTAPKGKFLVVGCGSIGRRHLANLQTLGVRDIIAFDIVEERRHEVAQKFHVSVYKDYEEALAQGARATLICSPTRLHLEQSLRAAELGCHLFIEKPIATSLEGLDQLTELVQANHIKTLVGCNFRFHPGLQQVKSLLAAGKVGNIVSARAQFGQYLPNWHPWEDYRQGYSARRDLGGGVLLDRIHELDYVRWLLGDVSSVAALIGKLSHLEIDTEDTVDLLLRFAGGYFGTVHVDYVRRTYDCSFEVVGDQGTIQWSFQDHRVRWFTAADNCWHSLEWQKYEANTMYLDQFRHFFRLLEGEEPSVADVNEGARVLEIALAARQAADEGKVITL